MKISVNDQEIFTLTDHHKQVIKNDISEDIFEEDIKRRMHWVLMHKYELCFERLEKEWRPKLEERYNSLPTKKEELFNLISSQPDYKCKKQRDLIENQLTLDS